MPSDWSAGDAAAATGGGWVSAPPDLPEGPPEQPTGRAADRACEQPPKQRPDPPPELVVMVGLQASGKSTWVREHLAASHVVVSKDHWPRAKRREARQQRLVREALAAGRDVVVDNTNPSPEERAPLVALAREFGARVRAVYLDVPFAVCVARNATRAGRERVPLVGLLAARKRLRRPTSAEGFDAVERVGVQPSAVAAEAADVR